MKPPAPEQTEETQPAEEAVEEETAEDVNFIVIETGDFSDEVATVQSKLAELGYFGMEPTGLFGDFTTEAIVNFQLANGLEATGLLDTQTYMLLFSDDAIASAIPAVGAQDEAVAEEEPALVEDATEAETASEDAPLTKSEDASQLVTSDAANSAYAATASKSVAKANEVTAKALEKSSRNCSQRADRSGKENGQHLAVADSCGSNSRYCRFRTAQTQHQKDQISEIPCKEKQDHCQSTA